MFKQDIHYIKLHKSQFKESEIPSLIKSLKDFYEAKQSNKIWYTGRTAQSQSFSLDYVGRAEAIDQEGPGYYFTSSMQDARGYAHPDGIVMTCMVDIKKLCPLKGRPNPQIVNTLIKNAPDLEMTLSNWDENPQRALRSATTAMMDQDSPLESYMQIWYDFYRHHPAEYLRQISKFYSGHLAKRDGGVEHLIVYDPSIISISNVSLLTDLQEDFGTALHPFVIRPAFQHEHEELHRTAQELEIPYQGLLKSFFDGRLELLTDGEWMAMENTESFRVKNNDEARSIAKKYGRYGADPNEWRLLLMGFANGDPVEAPIVLYRQDHNPYLVAGNTRLSLMRGNGITPMVWKIFY
jgi:hypothetical protein